MSNIIKKALDNKLKTDNTSTECTERICFAAAVIFFCVYVVITVFIANDYGISVDEEFQRYHGLVSYKYVNNVLLDRNLDNYDIFENIPELGDYKSRYYGVFFQLPFVFIEDLFDFSLSYRHIFLIRHVGHALFCCIGFFAFFMFIKGITSSSKYGFAGLLFISLYPRFFAEKCYNPKDIIFVACSCLAYYSIYLYLENDNKPLYGVFAGAAGALATFSRTVGIMFPVILIGYLFVVFIFDSKKPIRKAFIGKSQIPVVLKCILDQGIIAVSYLFFWYVGTPAAWFHNPVTELYKSVVLFGDFPWNAQELFAGQLYRPKEMPWYYLFTWIFMTVPVIYIVLFCLGHFSIFKKKERLNEFVSRMLIKDKYLSLAIIMWWGPAILVATHMIKIYNGWRHMYFLMCPMIIMGIYGLHHIITIMKKHTYALKVIWGILSVSFILQIGWIGINHPYEYVYFSTFARKQAPYYMRDYWKVSGYNMVKWIAENDDREIVTIDNSLDVDIFKNIPYLPDEEASKFEWINDGGDYEVYFYKNDTSNEHVVEGYNEVYSIVIDGFKIGSVYRRED